MAGTKQPLTPLAMAILELLHEKPMHPYEMTQLMRQRRVDYRVKLRPGSLYHTVERLEAQAHIEVVDTQRQGRRPERTVYAMTEKGRDTFQDQVREMLSVPAQEYRQYTVALSAANELDQADAMEQLRMRVVNLKAQLAADEVVIQTIPRDLPAMYWIDYAYLRHQRMAELDFTEKFIGDLESGRITWPDETQPDDSPHLSIVDDKETDDGKAS